MTNVHRNTKHLQARPAPRRGAHGAPATRTGTDPVRAVGSVIRFSSPRHAVRHERRGLIRHPATKVVAAPLVTAGIVALDAADLATAPHSLAATSAQGSAAARDQWSTPFVHVAQSPVAAPTTTVVPPAIVTPAVNTATTQTTVHLWPTTTKAPAPPVPRSRSAPTRGTHHTTTTSASHPTAAAAAAAAAPVPHTAKTIPLGVYVGSGDPSGVAQFAATTGTHPVLASDYLLWNDGWAAMDGQGGSESWMLSQWAGTGYRLVLGVPMIPEGTGATLAQGATGAYDQYFTTLAQTLVAGGAANAVLRLGWEFNGTWYPWGVASDTDAQNFAAYWRQIVTTMRAVPGADFSFVWNPNLGGSSSWNLEDAYPGSGYVDYIGADVYDEFWGTPFTPQASWSNAVNQTWGLNWLVNFAATEGRAIAIPEWSVSIRSDGYGLGDDPYFIDQFAAWIGANDVGFTSIYSYDDSAAGQDDDLLGGSFPDALAAFRTEFG
ncbi:MAG TPA: glycosyl hydrolase [Acidimicrobiales bacterium]|nr:glycosyl hydrolase [Acidimicrobiales bacterium]